MKKILAFIYCIVAVLCLTGCGMGNTPTKKVEAFLNKYKTLDSTVITQMDNIVSTDSSMSDKQKDDYRDVLKKQYQDLTYEIKDETVNGDNAVVKTEIEVYDFYKATNTAAEYYAKNPDKFLDTKGAKDESKYIDYRIEQIKNTSERVKYTIDFNLVKVNNEWVLEDIDDATRLKIHGLYEY